MELNANLFIRYPSDEQYGPSKDKTQVIKAPSVKSETVLKIEEAFLTFNTYNSAEMLELKNTMISEVNNSSEIGSVYAVLEMMEPRFSYRQAQDKAIFNLKEKMITVSSSTRIEHLYNKIKNNINAITFETAKEFEITFDQYFIGYIDSFETQINLEIYRDTILRKYNDEFNKYLNNATFSEEERDLLWENYKRNFDLIISATSNEEIDARYNYAINNFLTVPQMSSKQEIENTTQDISMLLIVSISSLMAISLTALIILRRKRYER